MRINRPHSYGEYIADAALKRPGDTAIVHLDTGAVYSNAEMFGQAMLWSGVLRKYGVARKQTVAVIMPNIPEAYFVWLGVAWIGAYEVPLNTQYRGTILAHVLNNSKIEIAIVSEEFLPRLAELAGELRTLKRIIVPDGEGATPVPGVEIITRAEAFAGAVAPQGLSPPASTDVASIVYTSGTTGPSKGAIISWANFAGNAQCVGYEEGHNFRLYSTWTSFHVSGKFAFVEAIARGGAMYLRQRWSSELFWPDVNASKATAAILIGNVANFLWSRPESPDDAKNSLTDVAMTPVPKHYREFEQRFGLRIHAAYAMTEISIVLGAPHPLPNNRTCGRPVPGCEVRLVDPDGNDVGPNQMGEAWVRCENPGQLFYGYYNMPEKTAESWVGDWFRTGDGLMRDEEGNYYFVDRVKDSLRRRGENISSFEVESEFNRHPKVVESAAVEVKTPDGDVEVMIYVVPEEGAPVTEREVLEFAAKRMARFMVPRYVRFLPALPKTHTNRVRKVELRDLPVELAWDRLAAGVRIE